MAARRDKAVRAAGRWFNCALPPSERRGLKLSIIIPVLNEAANISAALVALQPLRERGAEVIAVDGGSSDDTFTLAQKLCDHVITAPRGRANQQNAGARIAKGEALLFLHSDTRLPDHVDALVQGALTTEKSAWGRFDVKLGIASEPPHAMFTVIAALMNFRSRMTGVATGDQCIFVRKAVFDAVGGFPQISLMEDIALSKALRRVSAPACLTERVTTSTRRWQTRGVWRTVLLMGWLRLAYWLGVSPARLAAWYR